MFNKFLGNSRAKKICGIGTLATLIGFSSLGSVSAGVACTNFLCLDLQVA